MMRCGSMLLLIGVLRPFAIGGQQPPLQPTCSAYADVPLPAEAGQVPAPLRPPDCASYRSYAGIGRPKNLNAARDCAWRERLAQKADLGQNDKQPTAWIVGGGLILSDIYFNGAGVARNVPLAMRLACEFDTNTAELALSSLRKGGAHTGKFELCDYAYSTPIANSCTAYTTELDNEKAQRFYRRLQARMTPDQRRAFRTLLLREAAYVNAHAEEVNQDGTFHFIRTAGSQNILTDAFRVRLVHLERAQWPQLSEQQLQNAENRMRIQYDQTVKTLQHEQQTTTDQGAVTPEGLSTAQRAWVAYWGAWTDFARLRYPGKSDTIRAAITMERTRLLKTIAD